MITLQYEQEVIQLRATDLPTYSLDLKTSFQRDMNGNLRGRTQRPHCLIFDINVYLLTFEKYVALRAFIIQAQGNVILYTDEEGEVRHVRLLTEPTTISQSSPNQRTASLQLEEVS